MILPLSIFIVVCLWWAAVFFLFYEYHISQQEKHILSLFRTQSNIIPSLYELSKWTLNKHQEIFESLIALRKQEFHMQSLSHDLRYLGSLEKKISHEIQFVFTACDNHPQLIKKKQFLYMRDIMIQQPLAIRKALKKRNVLIEHFNNYIRYKNLSLIWYILPFQKKEII